MNIYDHSMRTILTLMVKSTGHRYYAAELHRITGISKPTIYKTLATAKSARFVDAQEEDLGFCPKRAPRICYTPTQYGIDAVRLTPLSSI
jgi:DNA-binding PadR family transcriptional regulator